MVVGKMNPMKAFYSDFHYLHLDRLLVLVIVSHDSIVGISPTGGEHGHRRCQCSGFLHRRSSPRHPGPRSEITLHGVRQGVAVALTAAKVRTRYELHAMEIGFPMGDGPEEHEDLIKEFVIAVEAILDITSAQDVVNKVFD